MFGNGRTTEIVEFCKLCFFVVLVCPRVALGSIERILLSPSFDLVFHQPSGPLSYSYDQEYKHNNDTTVIVGRF